MTKSKKAAPGGVASPANVSVPALDMTAPDARWTGAISRWLSGDPALFTAAISDTSLELTSDAREFIAALADGRIKKGVVGRPTKYEPWFERSIVAALYSEHELALADPTSRSGSPQDRAFELVAERHLLTADAVRGLVAKLRAQGWTLERWQQWGKPNFMPRK